MAGRTTARRNPAQLLDEILNSLLFLLIGLEIVAINETGRSLVLGLIGIGCVLVGRAISVMIPIRILGFIVSFPKGTITLLTWGGLWGAISIALAFLLPPGQERELLISQKFSREKLEPEFAGSVESFHEKRRQSFGSQHA